MRTKTIFLAWLAMFNSIAYAQITSGLNEYRDGDAVWRQKVNDESITRGNSIVLADLSSMEVISDNHMMKLRCYDNDSVAVYDNITRYDYQQTDDSLLIIGSEGHLLRIMYDRPEQYLRFSMTIGDSIGGIYSGRGTYCERLFLHTFGTYKTVADGEGCIVLPDGDTLRNVVRLRTERTVSTRYLPLDSVMKAHGSPMCVPSLPLDSIYQYMQTDTAMAHVAIHRYYAQGFRYPILEEQEVRDGEGNIIEATAYYCSPEEQALLVDVENERVREWHGRTLTEDTDNTGGRDEDGGFHYGISNDRSGRQVFISYTSARGEVRVLLCDRTGIVYQRASGNGEDGTITVGYGGLHRGQYVIYISMGSEQYSEKINVR